jgi:hypothetical protein
MIFKITWNDHRIDWCTAQDVLHLLKSYDKEFDLCLRDIENVEAVSDEEAKRIEVNNTEYSGDGEMPKTLILSDLVSTDSFEIIASTDFL